MPKVDVIVLNHNGRHFLRPCLTSLRHQTYQDFQVTLVDNASTDGSVELARAEFPEVGLLPLPENFGFCGGNNRGIKATSGQYLVLLNNDTEVAPECLQALVDVLDRNPEVGFCASKMVRMSDGVTIDTAGDVFYTHGLGGKTGDGEPAENYNEPRRVFGACAGAAIYRRSMLDDIGLLDEDFFATDEDIDLSFRAQLRNYRCQYVPEAVVYHHVGGAFGPPSANNICRGRRNMLEVLIKNMPAPLLRKYLPLILAYFVGGDIYYILRGQAAAIFKARWQNLRRLPRTMAKRSVIQDKRTVTLKELEKVFTSVGWAGVLSKCGRCLSNSVG